MMPYWQILLVLMLVGLLQFLEINRKPEAWLRKNQLAQRLEDRGEFEAAAVSYDDPMRQGAALYRAGDFERASATFSRIATAEGAYNHGNALLMHGAYADSIAAYDRALKLKPQWTEAIENRAIAVARKARIENVEDDQTGGQEEADKIVFDNKAKGDRAHEVQINSGKAMSDEQMQAAWLRRVQTKESDFLAAKFSYQSQAQSAEAQPE